MSNPPAAAAINADLIEKYRAAVPRYTSYPTAPNFSSDYTTNCYATQAKQSNEALLPRDLSLYIHVPFCHSLCYFCGCNKVVTQRGQQKVGAYLENLTREISLRAALFDGDRRVSQIHFGGGTPNFLRIDQIAEILEKIASCFHLDLPSRLEISIEIDPRVIDAKGIQELAKLGFNRYSVGVQDFAPGVQKAINRLQSKEQTLAVIDAAMKLGDSVNVDLIAGLPKQTCSDFKDTLDTLVDVGVSRFAVYNFAYLPQQIKAQRLINPNDLPDTDLRTKLAQMTRNTLLASGFTHIGMDHFARPDDALAKALANNTLQRNFQGYTTHANTDLVGLGVSAISQFANGFAQNHSDLSAYANALRNEQLPIAKGYKLSIDDQLRAALIQQIMCRQRVDLSQKTRKFANINADTRMSEYFKRELPALQPFIDDGLVDKDESGFVFTEQGGFFRRQIAACFDSYLPSDATSTKTQRQTNVVKFSQTI